MDTLFGQVKINDLYIRSILCVFDGRNGEIPSTFQYGNDRND